MDARRELGFAGPGGVHDALLQVLVGIQVASEVVVGDLGAVGPTTQADVVAGGRLVLDEAVDDVVLQSVHDVREQHLDEDDLQLLVALGPPQGPVADARDPGQHDGDDEHAYLHADQAADVDDALLEPPPRPGRVAVVARLDRLGRLAETRVRDERRGDAEQDDEYGNAARCLREREVSALFLASSWAPENHFPAGEDPKKDFTYIDGQVEEVEGARGGRVVVGSAE